MMDWLLFTKYNEDSLEMIPKGMQGKQKRDQLTTNWIRTVAREPRNMHISWGENVSIRETVKLLEMFTSLRVLAHRLTAVPAST